MMFSLLLLACVDSEKQQPPESEQTEQTEVEDPVYYGAPAPDWAYLDLQTTEPDRALSGLLINELMPRNQSTVMAPDQSLPDWVEIYNSSEQTIDLSRVSLWDDSSGDVWFGEGEIAPGEHLLLWADDSDEPGHLPFRMDTDGDALNLSVDGVLEDRISTGPVPGDIAWARFPDGGDWSPTTHASPGRSNGRFPSESADPRDVFFGLDGITDIYLYVDEADYNGLNSRQEVEGSLRFEGIYFSQVSLKLKGSGSYQSLSGKSGFKVDINEFVSGQRLRGLKALTLNNGNHDATWSHEYLTYRLFRELSMPAPRVGWSRVWLNDDYYGLYMNIETYDDVLVDRWFTDADEGTLWEGAGDFDNNSVVRYEEGPEPVDNGHIEAVQRVLDGQATDAAIAELSRYVDLESFLTYNALEALILHWDGYQSPNNWRLFHDAVTDRLYWLPTGTDWTWMYNYRGAFSGNGDVFRFCLENADCSRRYAERVIEVVDIYETLNFPTIAEQIEELLAADISADPRKNHSTSKIVSERETTMENLTLWPEQLRLEAERELDGLP